MFWSMSGLKGAGNGLSPKLGWNRKGILIPNPFGKPRKLAGNGCWNWGGGNWGIWIFCKFSVEDGLCSAKAEFCFCSLVREMPCCSCTCCIRLQAENIWRLQTEQVSIRGSAKMNIASYLEETGQSYNWLEELQSLTTTSGNLSNLNNIPYS